MVTSTMLASSLVELQRWTNSNADFQEGIQYGICLGYKAGFNLSESSNEKYFNNFIRFLDLYINRPDTFKKFDVYKYFC